MVTEDNDIDNVTEHNYVVLYTAFPSCITCSPLHKIRLATNGGFTFQRMMKEKNALAERLKNAEQARKRVDEELKRFANDAVTHEELRLSLEAEVQRLTQTVGQTEGRLREKEEQVMRCEAYIDGMEAKLHACKVCC
jgi:predicted nuclease with TOPRIM domain